MQRKIRVLVGKPGLDGHDRGAKVVAAALRDAGMEVIYTGLHQSPEQIVEAALQEDVDVIALSILSGAHMTLFTEVIRLMKEHGIEDKLLTGGGIIPPEDMETLAGQGVGRLFGPGASTQDIATYIRSWFGGRADRPAPRARATLTRSTRAKASATPTPRAKATATPKPRAKARLTGARVKTARSRSGSRSAPKRGTHPIKRSRAAATGRR